MKGVSGRGAGLIRAPDPSGRGLATAFYICEAFGFEAGIDQTWKSAPQFYTLFTAIIGLACLVILIPSAPLISITIWTQTLNGILLPVVLIAMIRLVNNQDLMDEYTNGVFSNLIGWTTIIILLVLTIILFALPFLQHLLVRTGRAIVS